MPKQKLINGKSIVLAQNEIWKLTIDKIPVEIERGADAPGRIILRAAGPIEHWGVQKTLGTINAE